MNVFELAVAWSVDTLLLAALAGLVVKRGYRECYTFAPYLTTVLVSDLLILFWPERFFLRSFWLQKEIAINALRFAVAMELAFRTFRAFPGARSTARRLLLALLVGALVAVIAATGSLGELFVAQDVDTLIGRIQPRVLNGTIWLLTAIAALILWYRLPVGALHKAILVGTVPFLLVFTTGLNALETYGWHAREWISYVQSLCYFLVAAYWAYAAWQPAAAPVQAPERARILARHVS